MSNDIEVTRIGALLCSPEGEYLMGHLAELFEKRSSIVPGDPYATHAREGAREVVLYLRDIIEDFENE